MKSFEILNFQYKILSDDFSNDQDFAKLTWGTGQRRIRYID